MSVITPIRDEKMKIGHIQQNSERIEHWRGRKQKIRTISTLSIHRRFEIQLFEIQQNEMLSCLRTWRIRGEFN